MDDNNIDRVVMLLSTDWFFAHWSGVGIRVSQREGLLLQEGFRDIVRQIVSEAAQYWLASFSIERVRQTSLRIEALSKISRVRPSVADSIKELTSGRPKARADQKTAWLLLSITGMLCDNSLGEGEKGLAASVRALLRSAYADRQVGSVGFETENLRSKSPWDEYVRSLTPDLPTCLSDYASSLLKQSEFENFWNLVCSAATHKELEEILNWYRFQGGALTGEDVDLPATLLE